MLEFRRREQIALKASETTGNYTYCPHGHLPQALGYLKKSIIMTGSQLPIIYTASMIFPSETTLHYGRNLKVRLMYLNDDGKLAVVAYVSDGLLNVLYQVK